MNTLRRLKWVALLIPALILVSGCKQSSAENGAQAPVPQASIPVVDSSCQVDADCVVKNVGNCCGYYPACVNVKAEPDPEAVSKKCAADGMASICGFPDISACSCVNNVCQPHGGSGSPGNPVAQ